MCGMDLCRLDYPLALFTHCNVFQSGGYTVAVDFLVAIALIKSLIQAFEVDLRLVQPCFVNVKPAFLFFKKAWGVSMTDQELQNALDMETIHVQSFLKQSQPGAIDRYQVEGVIFNRVGHVDDV